MRAFYDLHGQFDPVFSISKLPHQGDIAGGAIDNVSAVLTGAAPVYRKITLGTPDPNNPGAYVIPPEGSNIGGVAVTLGLPLPLGLPIFYPEAVAYSQNTCKNHVVTPITPAADARSPPRRHAVRLHAASLQPRRSRGHRAVAPAHDARRRRLPRRRHAPQRDPHRRRLPLRPARAEPGAHHRVLVAGRERRRHARHRRRPRRRVVRHPVAVPALHLRQAGASVAHRRPHRAGVARRGPPGA